MQLQTPTYSNAPSETSAGFNSASRYGVRGVDRAKFRTRLCRNFAMGVVCPFGDRCAFSHCDAEVPCGVQPPSYSEAVSAGMTMPPAYPSRYRHDPYSFDGIMFE